MCNFYIRKPYNVLDNNDKLMTPIETIWSQIENSFEEEAKEHFDKEVAKYDVITGKVLASGKSVKAYFIDACGEKDFCNNELYRDIIGYGLIVSENGVSKLSPRYKDIVNRVADFLIRTLKWKLKRSVYGYLAGIDIQSFENTYLKRSFNNFSGVWVITDTKGNKGQYKTETIVAEGPIVSAHLRYISHVDSNLASDSVRRASALKLIESKKPKLEVSTKEEKELAKRIAKITSEIKRFEWLSTNHFKNESQIKSCVKTLEKLKIQEAEIKNTSLETIRLELKFKEDTKNYKDDSEKLSRANFKLERALTKENNKDLVELISNDIKEFETKIAAYYTEYPAVKLKETKARVNFLTKEIKYIKSTLAMTPANKNDVYINNITNDLVRYESELKLLINN